MVNTMLKKLEEVVDDYINKSDLEEFIKIMEGEIKGEVVMVECLDCSCKFFAVKNTLKKILYVLAVECI